MDTALTAARAEGYAEAVADVVSWLRAVAFVGCADLIEDGAHVGAAKKGGA